MTRDADNRTTELREKLTERGIEWRSGLEGVTFVDDWCFVEYENGRLAATCEPVLTPEQAIAATMGGQRSTVEIDELLDEFESECFMLRVEASETRARDDVVRESYERILNEFAGRIAATVGQGTCIPHGEWERLSQTQEFRRMYCDCGYELGMDSRDSFPFARTAYAAMPRFCPECGARIVSKGKAVKR